MAATARPSGRHSPASTISTPAITNAPTAARNPPAIAPVLASKAAPGVDQTTLIGWRVARLTTTPPSPIAIAAAISPDATSASLAPIAVRPCRITANELANPTTAASSPAATACADSSFSTGAAGVQRSSSTSIKAYSWPEALMTLCSMPARRA